MPNSFLFVFDRERYLDEIIHLFIKILFQILWHYTAWKIIPRGSEVITLSACECPQVYEFFILFFVALI